MSANFSGSKINGILAICSSLAILVFVLTFGACTDGKTEKLPDLEGIKSDLKVLRLEQMLGGQADASAFRTVYDGLEASDSALISFYEKHLAGLPVYMQELESYPDSLYTHLYIPLDTTGLLEAVEQQYASWPMIESELDLAYRLHRYYLGNAAALPPIFTYIAPFGYPVALSEEWLAVSLDMFMGSDWPEYQQITGLYNYQLPRMTPEYLPIAIMKSVISDQLDRMPPNASVLDHMIYHGKQLYYLQKVLPGAEEHTLIGYSPEQLAWCEKYQEEIWGTLVTDGSLYSKKAGDVQRITGEGPNTKGMGDMSPGRVGMWIGWQIVQTYMKRQENPDLQALMAVKEGQTILENSRWKPARK